MVVGCGCLALANPLWVSADDAVLESYLGIVDRNAFGLKDPPPPASELPPPQAPVNITFTGIVNVGGQKKAYFRLPGKEPNSFIYSGLKEGEQEGPIKVLEGGIDEAGGKVKILNAGAPLTLDFEANGNKTSGPSAVAPAPGAPGVPGMPGAVLPPTGIRQPPGVTHGAPMFPGGANPGGATGAAIPTRNVRAQAAATAQQDSTAYLTSQVNIEVQRAANAQAIASGDHPPLPPTDFSEEPGTATPVTQNPVVSRPIR